MSVKGAVVGIGRGGSGVLRRCTTWVAKKHSYKVGIYIIYYIILYSLLWFII